MKKLFAHVKRWNRWRKHCLNGKLHKALVLLGVIKSPTMQNILIPEEEAEMAAIKYLGELPEGIEISAPISGYQGFLAELKKQEMEEIRKVFSGEKTIMLKAGVEAPAVELIPVPLSAPIVKASETGENWEQFCERFGILYAYGPKATVKFSVSTVISREFFDAYGPQATINAIRRDCFRSLMDAILKIEGKSID